MLYRGKWKSDPLDPWDWDGHDIWPNPTVAPANLAGYLLAQYEGKILGSNVKHVCLLGDMRERDWDLTCSTYVYFPTWDSLRSTFCEFSRRLTRLIACAHATYLPVGVGMSKRTMSWSLKLWWLLFAPTIWLIQSVWLYSWKVFALVWLEQKSFGSTPFFRRGCGLCSKCWAQLWVGQTWFKCVKSKICEGILRKCFVLMLVWTGGCQGCWR